MKKYHVEFTKNLSEYIPRFQFYDYMQSTGLCLVHLQIQDGFLIYFCSSMLNYRGCSVIESSEYIRDAIVEYLYKHDALHVMATQITSPVKSCYTAKSINRNEITQAVNDFMEHNSIGIAFCHKNNAQCGTSSTMDSIMVTHPQRLADTLPLDWDGWKKMYPTFNFDYKPEDLLLSPEELSKFGVTDPKKSCCA